MSADPTSYAIGPISGCHINSAVTVGLLLSKKLNPRYAAGYLVAQPSELFSPLGSCCSLPKAGRPRMIL